MVSAAKGRRSARFLRSVAMLLAIALAGASAAAAARIAWVGFTVDEATDRRVLAGQLHHLEGAVDAGAGERMQRLFPEGFVFTHALVGLAMARSAELGDRHALRRARAALAAVESAPGRAPFPAGQAVPHGAFWSAWRLQLAIEVARLSGTSQDREVVEATAVPLVRALAAESDGYLESYPGQTWPVDTVVLVAALARARDLAMLSAAPAVDDWLSRTSSSRDPATGLIPHRVDATGRTLDGPRGSSQALILAFEPDIDPSTAQADYESFVESFVVRRLGLVGVREYPIGTPGSGDVDSGPLVAGVSASASAVALAAARRHGDAAVAEALNQEAEILGVPVQWGGSRRYGFGVVPVGEAFLAWARAQPWPDAAAEASSGAPQPRWTGWVAAWLSIAAGATVIAITLGHRRPVAQRSGVVPETSRRTASVPRIRTGTGSDASRLTRRSTGNDRGPPTSSTLP